MLSDTHYAVLELLKAGQPLVTKRVHGRTTAKIGPQVIPEAIVDELVKAKLIRCYQVDNYGAQHGKLCHYEPVTLSHQKQCPAG